MQDDISGQIWALATDIHVTRDPCCALRQCVTPHLLGVWLKHVLDEAVLDGQDLWEL
jgi:hypothetical protein